MLPSFRSRAAASLVLAFALSLAGCEPSPGAGHADPGDAPSSVSDEPSQATAADAADAGRDSAAPWEAGFERAWFYPHPRPAEDPRWARIARLVGEPAPELVGLADWRRTGPVELAALRGRVVLLEFWATWCSDCKAAVPVVEALAERLADEPFSSLSVCASRGGERYTATLADWGIRLPTALDAEGDSESAYDVPRWPYHVLIDADGRVAAAGLKTAHLAAAVETLLARERARGALSQGDPPRGR